MALFDKNTLDKLKQKASDVISRGIDQHIHLAVTGLSRSGKTAFITSFVNQLLNEGDNSQLGFFKPVQEKRFIAAKRVNQQHLHIPRFEYENAMSAFKLQDPVWPEPTKGISEIRIALKYQPDQSLLKYASSNATLYIDITDYPGEWLLDLPMLNQTYEQWSIQMNELLLTEPRKSLAAPLLDKLSNLDVFQEADESLLAELSAEYTELLHQFRNDLGLSVIQPGRFILPGELAGAPILQFFPFPTVELLDGNEYQNAGDDTLIGMLRARFIEYKERVVRQFYKEHFADFDRQIILADVLGSLNGGPAHIEDLKWALSMIMQSFAYGQSGMLSRLFSPKIDKLLFAVTKADHVTPEQHDHLVALLNQIMHEPRSQLNYDGIKMKTLAVSSVQATQNGKSHYQGQTIPVLQGRAVEEDKLITLYPGVVPAQLPNKETWPEQGFKYKSFLPKAAIAEHQSLPHVRMDQVMQFLLGDKMK